MPNEKTTKQLADEMIKRLARDGALRLSWSGGKAKVEVTGYESWMWREHLIQLLGKRFVLQLDKSATELLTIGSHRSDPKE